MGQSIEFHFAPQGDTLEAYINCRDRVTMIMGPLGSAKTTASCERVFKQMCEQAPDENNSRKSRWMAIRNTYPDLTGTTMKDWCELYHNEHIKIGRMDNSFPPTHYMDFDLEDGTRVIAELVFLALDNEKAVRKLRGTQITGFWLNEVKELDKAIVDMCDGRHGRYPQNPTWHGMIGDTNAPDSDHWYYELAEQIKPAGWTFLRQPGGVLEIVHGTGMDRLSEWVENPHAENLHNLPDGYYINQVGSKKDDWIRVNLANQYGHVSSGKPIYQGLWNDAIHVAKYPLSPIVKVPKIMIGIDFGRTPAAVVGQLMPNGKLRVIKELIATGMGIRSFMDTLVMPYINVDLKRFNKSDIEVYGDPAGVAKSGNDENSPLGIINDEYNLAAYPTASNKPERRWEAVNTFLTGRIDGAPAMEISPDCPVLIKGYNGGYAFRRLNVSGEKYADAADKNAYSHPHDAKQYLCQGAQGEIDYAWRDAHLASTNTNQSMIADSTTGY